jgi:hypothetical protein
VKKVPFCFHWKNVGGTKPDPTIELKPAMSLSAPCHNKLQNRWDSALFIRLVVTGSAKGQKGSFSHFFDPVATSLLIERHHPMKILGIDSINRRGEGAERKYLGEAFLCAHRMPLA